MTRTAVWANKEWNVGSLEICILRKGRRAGRKKPHKWKHNGETDRNTIVYPPGPKFIIKRNLTSTPFTSKTHAFIFPTHHLKMSLYLAHGPLVQSNTTIVCPTAVKHSLIFEWQWRLTLFPDLVHCCAPDSHHNEDRQTDKVPGFRNT
jgi:hypothetical protein